MKFEVELYVYVFFILYTLEDLFHSFHVFKPELSFSELKLDSDLSGMEVKLKLKLKGRRGLNIVTRHCP